MSKIDEVRSAMVAAMKAKDKDTKETLSALLAALKNKAIDKRADLTEEEEVQVILKEIKQTKESLEMTPSDRTDMIEECKRRLAVLETFAPKMMDADEIIVSSSTKFCSPACEMNGTPIGGKAPELVDLIQKKYTEKFENETM